MTWVEQLPNEMAGQRRLLRGLLSFCEAEESIRWLVIGCSVARGAGDHLSDLDVAIGARDDDFGDLRQLTYAGETTSRNTGCPTNDGS